MVDRSKSEPAGPGGAEYPLMPGIRAALSGAPAAGPTADKTVAAVLGEIVWLMSQSPRHKTFMIADLEAHVMPAVLLRQFRLFYEKQVPIGVILYARMSVEAAARLDAGAPSLRPADWQSGPVIRIVDVVAPFGGREEMEAEFKGAIG